MNDKVGTELESPLPVLYKEYARLAGSFEAQLSSTFKDFQMFGAIGAVLAWYPIAENLLEDGAISLSVVVLMGFIAIASIVAILDPLWFAGIYLIAVMILGGVHVSAVKAAIRCHTC